MFEQDYLMRLLLQFFKAMNRAAELKEEKNDPQGASDMLEAAIGSATEMDGVALLSLAPESIAQVMKISGIDPNVTQFVARSLLLDSVYLAQAHQGQLSAIRAAQARAIAAEYGFDLPEDPSDFEAITEGLEEAAALGGFVNQTAMYREGMGDDGDTLQSLIDSAGIAFDDPEVFEDPDTYFEPIVEHKPRRRFGSFVDGE